jgi:hypothetical protein
MIKDIIVNLSVAKNGSTVGNYAVSVAAAFGAGGLLAEPTLEVRWAHRL